MNHKDPIVWGESRHEQYGEWSSMGFTLHVLGTSPELLQFWGGTVIRKPQIAEPKSASLEPFCERGHLTTTQTAARTTGDRGKERSEGKRRRRMGKGERQERTRKNR